MSLEKEFEKTWKAVSEDQNRMDTTTDRKIWEGIHQKIRRRKSSRKWYWAAALIVPFFIFLMIYNGYQHSSNTEKQNYVYESFESSKNIQLSDGSKIGLLPYSRLVVSRNFGEKDRNIIFTGQASFSITKDKTKPFRINAGDFHVQVLGTRFFLDQRSEEKKVELFEGKVKIEHSGKVTYLLPKEIWMSGKGHSDYHYYNREKQMSFTFTRSKYAEAVQKLEETYHVRISYPDRYKERIVSGSFTGNLNDILSIISYPFNLKIEKNNETEEIILK
ncbi:FecR family protein [Chryseobacterium sp.]|uniref:FecR family protein n=1 Tax=Chryseobacterium sp. TaxID=1871047 RepID=UPI0025B8DDBC|nr:FecR family protein [Chryseobacterium sp.]MBV8327301.1 FecR family protein [Chryseobacterium sp.]